MGPVVDTIIATAESTDLQVDSDDAEGLVEEHLEELSTDQLQKLLSGQQGAAAEELSEKEYQQSKQQSSSEIKEVLKRWPELPILVEKTTQTEKEPITAFTCLMIVPCHTTEQH